jgi:hypothetical protein
MRDNKSMSAFKANNKAAQPSIYDSRNRVNPLHSSENKIRNKFESKPSLDTAKENFLKEYEAKLREIKAKYDNKLDYLRKKYNGMDARCAV